MLYRLKPPQEFHIITFQSTPYIVQNTKYLQTIIKKQKQKKNSLVPNKVAFKIIEMRDTTKLIIAVMCVCVCTLCIILINLEKKKKKIYNS